MIARRFLLPIALAIVAAVLGIAAQVPTYSIDAVTQPEARFGLATIDEPELQDIYSSVPLFSLDGQPAGTSSAGARVFLWEFVKQINGGKNLPTLRQETGDCTAFSAVQGLHYLQAVQIALGDRHEFQELHPSFNYGVSRTAKDIGAGRLGRRQGAVGQWSVEAIKRYGVLAKSAPNVPAYSGRLSDSWGVGNGPPREFYAAAEPYRIGSYARCNSYELIRDAIASGYPVTIASNQGFQMRPTEHNGVAFGRPSGSWAHQMCFIGVDDSLACPDGSRGALYLLNSWGESAHGEPLNGEPAGGFWISKKTADRMATSGEAYAISEFSGFPYRPLNIRVFGSGAPEQLIAVSGPTPGIKYLIEYLGLERRHVFAVQMIALAGIGLVVWPYRRRFRNRGSAA